MTIFRMFWFKHFFGRYRWYRKWYGGRWEYWWIDICQSFLWLDMYSDRCWPAYRQPCGYGEPLIEDWPKR
jgi:hypothetical protein